MGFEERPHTADVALHFWGSNLAEAFISAAQGMAWLVSNLQVVEPLTEITLELSAYDTETLSGVIMPNDAGNVFVQSVTS